jgi:glutamate synthase (NADPH/NADH) large chain
MRARPYLAAGPNGHPTGLVDQGPGHDACGVACVARLDRRPRHEVIERALIALDRLEHRGAAGADGESGDGAGIKLALEREFVRDRADEFGVNPRDVPHAGRFAVASCFLPDDADRAAATRVKLERIVHAEGQLVLGWREVPTEPSAAGPIARESAPRCAHLLIGAADDVGDEAEFERRLFVLRRVAERKLGGDLSVASLSTRTIVYKGMLTASQLSAFYPDLRDERLRSVFAVVHSRFSTNTAPSWPLAQPLAMVAHNGEINTVRGNINWMRAREAALSLALDGELGRCLPLIDEGASDSAAFDAGLELLTLSGRSLPEALMTMIPMAHETRELPPALAGFYRFHARMMEPWDGPAAIVATDGRQLVASLDRNGLRPARWLVTRDGWVCVSSEAGSFDAEPETVIRKGGLRPGHLFVVDLEAGRVLGDLEAELDIARRRPYRAWHATRTLRLADLPSATAADPGPETLRSRQLAFGYSQEDLRVLIGQIARDGAEPSGSMGNDLALAALSGNSPSLFSYFKQRFAQVTNPPIDSVRERMVMSLTTALGRRADLLREEADIPLAVELEHPILTDSNLARLRHAPDPELRAVTLDATWPLQDGTDGLERAVERLCDDAIEAIEAGARQLIISDRTAGPDRVPIPALLATSAVHHHLTRAGVRLAGSIIVESGEPREVHHVAALIGYGAGAVNPYLMLESALALEGRAAIAAGDAKELTTRVVAGLKKGLLKVMSKMGISTIQSYRGAQIFEAVGLDEGLVERHFAGTPSRLGGIGLRELAEEALARHARAYPDQHGLPLPAHVEAARLPQAHERILPQGGVYQWRRDGELHMWEPDTVASLQHYARGGDDGEYGRFADLAGEENARRTILRGLLRLRTAAEPTPIDEVESAAEIARRFATGAMSLGALSPEAHETLAVAMNRIGAWSNSGEGGEDRRRNTPDPNGDERRSRIRQVASGRFGVDADYLAHADQIQIKMAQGAKPGEGGQLPGHKVDDYIASLRFSTPGVELISPPPHHDIYSIEDLKQLIFDLRAGNPKATVSVKLAAESGVGTVAAGVAKAGADHVVIAGHDGGTGASPQSSIQHAGVPWEIGLAETQQTLLASGLRDAVVLQADGGMRTGRDIVVAALLGADEVGISTAPLVALGCVMMRVCHMNTCPVGIATQDPVLRRKFSGRVEHVVQYLMRVAEEARELIASLGLRSWGELVGRVDLLEPDTSVGPDKARGLDLRPLLFRPAPPTYETDTSVHSLEAPPTETVEASFERNEVIEVALAGIKSGEPIRIRREIHNVDLAVGGQLSYEIVLRHGPDGLPDETVVLDLHGSAGQSLGAWLAPGVTIELDGAVNDYAGKGLSGGILACRPPEGTTFEAADNVIAGNVTLYGATRGRAFFNGQAGERFAIRNSGADAVVEGIGDHGCEYMTGGRVVVLGETGENFGAGMSGGVAWVHDPHGRLEKRTNHELVDLEPAPPERAEELRELIAEHERRTGSKRAARLLARWDEAHAEFTHVIPREYRKALAARAGESGEDRPEALEAAA